MGALVGVAGFCILVVAGAWGVCVCTIPGSVAFFCSEIFCCDVVGGDGAGVVHPATSKTMHRALNNSKKLFCITPAMRKRAIKVLLLCIFFFGKEISLILRKPDKSGTMPGITSERERGLPRV